MFLAHFSQKVGNFMKMDSENPQILKPACGQAGPDLIATIYHLLTTIYCHLQLPSLTSPSVLNSIHKISLFQFRNYASASFDFPEPVTCIAGLNGSGKTNLLDAVYYLCYTKSCFTSYQQNCVQTGMDGFRVTGEFTREGRKEVISAKWKGGKKELTANDAEYEKITDHIGLYSAVMIAPDDTELAVANCAANGWTVSSARPTNLIWKN
jgi:RecF/RecN/SMC N terminal domain